MKTTAKIILATAISIAAGFGVAIIVQKLKKKKQTAQKYGATIAEYEEAEKAFEEDYEKRKKQRAELGMRQAYIHLPVGQEYEEHKKKWIENYLENKKNKNSKKTETVLADGSTTIGLNSTDV